MKKLILVCAFLMAVSAQAVVYTDASGDIEPTISSGGGTLDILSMEVTHTATDLQFALTLNGNISTPNDWGNYMIAIATGGTGTTTGNAWNRPINMNSPIGGMDFWIGSWVNGGGGSQLWAYNGAAWTGPSALTSYTMTPGATSLLTYTVSLATLGLANGDTFYFDAYSSGGGATDSAVDALANPAVSITTWSQTYTSSTGTGIDANVIPEPATLSLLGLGALLVGYRARRRNRG